MNINFLKECTYHSVNLLKVPNELRNKIMEEAGLDADCTTYIESLDNIEFYNIPSEAVDWDDASFDEDQLESILLDTIGKFPHYLVFAQNCKWNGASGYKFCDNILNTVYRDYDSDIIGEQQGKNAIKCKEYSHDVPTGAPTYIIGLTEEEYEKLLDSDFNDIEQFVQSKF